MAGVQTFSPEFSNVTISTNVIDHIVTEFAEGTYINIEPANDRFTPTVGAKGEEYRSHNPSKAVTITVTLSQTSHSNDVLLALLNLDRETLDGTFTFTFKDSSGTTVYTDEFAYIMTEPTQAFSGNGGLEGREWQIRLPNPSYNLGGNGRFSSATQRVLENLGETVDPRWQSS